LEEQEVMVIFSGSKIGLAECNRVPKLTVLAVIIRFNSPKKLKDFQLKGQPFKLLDPSSPPNHGYKTFYYVKEGFMINAYKGKAIGLVFIAEQDDMHLCPEYYKDPKAFVEFGLFP